MSFLPMLAPWFAVAGLLAAAGPVLIHLLNRRRFRTVDWAAMDFLREAMQRSRKALEWRDLLLMILRTAAVLLFGLALARPFWPTAQTAQNDPDQPVHAIVIIDNSLSMSHQQLGGSLLDQAKARAATFLEELPPGSRMSVIPLCGAAGEISRDAYRTRQDALDALAMIEVVDRSGSAIQAADLVQEAARLAPDLPSKRVVFLGDQQLRNWPTGGLADALKALPEMQVVQMAPASPENAWIADFQVQDGLADSETSTRFLVTVAYEGEQARTGVQVRLSVDGTEVATQTVNLEPGQSRELEFPHRFDVVAEPGRPTYVAAKVSLSPDDLPQDDERYLSVPVVAALPVVFVDQYGADEDPRKNEYGETIHLRRLLAPIRTRSEFDQRQLVTIRHVRIDQVDRRLLEDAQLVVIAGVERPGPATEVLGEYVRQGGSLVICAGANFDPAAWTQEAWKDGRGILPLPLRAEAKGRLPDEPGETPNPFFLDPTSMVHDYFVIPGESPASLGDLYRSTIFFKAVEADVSEEAQQLAVSAVADQIAKNREFLTAWRQRKPNGSGAATAQSPETDQQQIEDEKKLNEIQPHWLLWGSPEPDRWQQLSPAELAEFSRPRVLAAYDNKLPFMIERELGQGRVVLVTTGVFSPWSTISKSKAVVVFDRLFRSLLDRSLPTRNYDTVERILLPIDQADRRQAFTLVRPGDQREPLSVEALGPDSYGVSIRNPVRRGSYLVIAERAEAVDGDRKLWQVPLAVNGPADESQLAVITENGLRERAGDANYRWISGGDSISLEGAALGQNLWSWFLLAVLLCLGLELLVLAWPALRAKGAA